jgi:single-stranded DNA-binding protein
LGQAGRDGRLRNNNYQDSEGADVYSLGFTAEEVDYLDSRAESEARLARERGDDGTPSGATGGGEQAGPSASSPKPRIARRPAHAHG